MTRYSIFSEKVDKWLLGILLVAMLYLSRDSLFCLFLLGFYPAQYCLFGLVGLLGAAFLLRNRKQLGSILRDTRILWCLLCACLFVLPMAIKQDWQLMYFSMLFCVVLAVFLTYVADWRAIAKLFVCILAFFSVVSLLTTYLLRIPADRGVLTPSIFYGIDDINFYNYYLSYVSVWYVKNRNFGIFREPGVHQYFILLALYLTNYGVKWEKGSHRVWMNILFSVTMLSTFATGGVIELGLFLVVLYLEQKWYRLRQGRILGVGAVAAGIIGIAAIILQHGALYQELYDMVIKFFNGSDSITDRVGSLMLNGQLFLSSPLWGRKLTEALYGIMNNTSSSTLLFAVLGIGGGLLNMLSWFALVWKKERPVIWNLALLLILAMAFNTENLITDPYFWLFPMMAMTERVQPALAQMLSKRKG